MPIVTVLGAHGQTVSLTYDSSANAILAQNVANAIDAGISGGSISPADSAFGMPPPLAPTKIGEFVQSGPGVTVLPKNYDYLVVPNTSPGANVFGNGDAGQNILVGTGNLNFFAAGTSIGSGAFIGGDGNELVSIPVTDAGAWNIVTGNGVDSIRALGAGNDSITAGLGNNQIQLGAGNDFLSTSGSDTILASTGAETINATGSDVITGLSSRLDFQGGSGVGATIMGGSGSDTVFGGSGSDMLFGGTGGNNFLQAGSGVATLFGGGDGDQLYTGGSAPQALFASGGNETLSGSFGSGNDTFTGGWGNDMILGGSGNNTIVAGTGQSTVQAAPSATSNVFEFLSTAGGGHEVVQNVPLPSDVNLVLSGYSPSSPPTQAYASGNLTITLSDSTTVVFENIQPGTVTHITYT
jgi:Ca2+-binding RTX toxin-like protein